VPATVVPLLFYDLAEAYAPNGFVSVTAVSAEVVGECEFADGDGHGGRSFPLMMLLYHKRKSMSIFNSICLTYSFQHTKITQLPDTGWHGSYASFGRRSRSDPQMLAAQVFVAPLSIKWPYA